MERIALFWSDACLLSGSFPSIGFKIRKPAAHSGNNAFRSIADVENFLFDYIGDLQWEEAYEALLTQISDEVFFLVFPNRRVLYLLNDMVAMYISDVKIGELEVQDCEAFSRNGVLKRHSIPEWVKRAVFYRDRGTCSNCNKDVSGTVSIVNEKHFDHIVPLAQGGINDVTNIQLLCDKCNLSSGKKHKVPSSHYERWYSTP